MGKERLLSMVGLRAFYVVMGMGGSEGFDPSFLICTGTVPGSLIALCSCVPVYLCCRSLG